MGIRSTRTILTNSSIRLERKLNSLNVRFHDLRHFFASMLIAQGESAKYVSDQLGHSSVQVTFDIYGHLFPTVRGAK